MQIERRGLAHPLPIEIHDEAVPPHAVVTHLNRFFSQIDWAFMALPVDREHIGLADTARFFDEEHFGRIGIVSQEFHPVAIQIEAINRRHLDAAVELRVVLIFDPLVRQPVEFIERRKRRMQGQKPVSKSAEEAFNLALGGTVANRRMRQMDIEPHAGLQDSLDV